MARVECISEIYGFIQSSLLNVLKVQFEIEGEEEIQKLLLKVKEIELDDFNEQYQIVDSHLRDKNLLFTRFNLLLDCCYFVSCIRKQFNNEIKYIHIGLNKLNALKERYSFPCVLYSFDSYITSRISTITNPKIIDK